MPIIECIPNVSEGRRPESLQALSDAVAAVAGVHLLDVSSDWSHNRSVLTMAGDAAALKDAVLALCAEAIARIDLRTHRGVHPRLGAVDVVPFVPIADVTMEECVALAQTTAAAVASRFALPVFLYEEAAPAPGRRRLEHVRRGQFEGLAAKMTTPQWAPDFGPPVPHPTAGATVIGARHPLIAYNVNLATNDVAVARGIAVAVRESSGGLPFVKAMGVALAERGIVQVSMNLTNFHQTSMATVFAAVMHEASRAGVDVIESEIVGLVPARAFAGTTPEALRLTAFRRDQILEERLRQSYEESHG